MIYPRFSTREQHPWGSARKLILNPDNIIHHLISMKKDQNSPSLIRKEKVLESEEIILKLSPYFLKASHLAPGNTKISLNNPQRTIR